MQNHQLTIPSLIEHACRVHARGEIVSRECNGTLHRTTYGEIAARARKVAGALAALDVRKGARVATLAWNNYRHMELYFGVSGMGAVLHTINPRLVPEQVAYIMRHAEDEVLFFDSTFAPLVAALAPHLPGVRAFVCMTAREDMPTADIPRLHCYEELLAAANPIGAWPKLDENAPSSLCYTSGTTGNPKGVLYSHRSTILHSMAMCSTDVAAVSGRDSILLVVPMFHVNAWGMAYTGAMCGAKLVLPGSALDGKSIYELMRDEGVNLALGVPTVWMGLLQHIESNGLDARSALRLDRVVSGGSAVPPSMIERFEQAAGARTIQAWGMTEMSPLGTVCTLMPSHEGLPREERLRIQAKQGRAVFGVELKLAGEDGAPLPHDGKAFGRLLVRGPWIVDRYYGSADSTLDADGFFDTGDIATIDADGYMQITDRAKDVIKSGGEWISSIDLENAAMSHPAVAMVAVIGLAHEKWQERPLMIVVPKPGQAADKGALMEHLSTRVARWWLPDDIVFADKLPVSGTGKVQKAQLRETYKNHCLQ